MMERALRFGARMARSLSQSWMVIVSFQIQGRVCCSPNLSIIAISPFEDNFRERDIIFIQGSVSKHHLARLGASTISFTVWVIERTVKANLFYCHFELSCVRLSVEGK